MAINELFRFCTEYLPNHPELKRTIDARGDARFAALAAVGQKAGFDFSEDEVRAVLTATPGAELSEDQLERVAGGRAGGDPLKYMEIKLMEVLVSGVVR
jgi:hypothetical protein